MSLILSLVMLLSVTAGISFNTEAMIDCLAARICEIASGSESNYFHFAPEKAERYMFRSSSNSDICFSLRDQYGNEAAADYYDGNLEGDDDFRYFCTLEITPNGWYKSGGKRYYLNTSVAMLANTSKKIGSKTYKFDKNGGMYDSVRFRANP